MSDTRPPDPSRAGAPVTRFAPSPTGMLHIGGARTALYNRLFAHGRGGKFLLRIEDTDKERSTQEAVDAILEGLDWLGLTPDEPPVFQSARAEAHQALAEDLLARGAAFRCWLEGEELEALREEAYKEGRALRSPWRDRDGSTGPAGKPSTVRLRAGEEDVTFHDAVRGTVTIPAKDLDDMVLLRADGGPTYMLAVVADDQAMGVTHIIRGEDHLTNMARQIRIYQAMGWTPPSSAHLALLHGPDGKKLSKRHGAQSVGEFRAMGYLPEGMRNYLLRLGWAKGDEELIGDERALELFDLEGIQKSPARLDFQKMAAVNAHYMVAADPARLLGDMIALSERGEIDTALDERDRARLIKALPVLRERAATVRELFEQAAFLLARRPLAIEGKAAKPLQGDGASFAGKAADRLESLENWTAESLHQALEALAGDEGVGFGKIGAPVRAALTGGMPSPDLGLVLEWLGSDESLARLRDQAS